MNPHFYIFCHGDRSWLRRLPGTFTTEKRDALRLTSKQVKTFKGLGGVYVIVPAGYGRTVTQRHMTQILIGIMALRQARDNFRLAGALKSRAYVARALKSAQGAYNHARRMNRNQEPVAPKHI